MLVFNEAISYAPPMIQQGFKLAFVFGFASLLFFLVVAGTAGRINQMPHAYIATTVIFCSVMALSLSLGIFLMFLGKISVLVGLAAAVSVRKRLG
jgi:hypothetical protein